MIELATEIRAVWELALEANRTDEDVDKEVAHILQQYGDDLVRDRDASIAKLKEMLMTDEEMVSLFDASPGADVIERVARRLIELEEGDPDGPTTIVDRPARWMLMIEDAQSIIALISNAPPGADATEIDLVARALLIVDDGGNADAILAVTEHAGDCPFVANPAPITCAKCQADHYRAVARDAIAAMRAPPGTDATALAQWAWDIWERSEETTATATAEVARRIQQYGDERAAAARDAAIEELKLIIVRALAAKPEATYVERDRGELQLATDHVLKEGDRMVSYCSVDGCWFCRLESEGWPV